MEGTNEYLLLTVSRIYSMIASLNNKFNVFSQCSQCFSLINYQSYEICSMADEQSIGSRVAIKVNTTCYGTIFDEIFGNPIVKLDDQHFGLVESLVRTDGQDVAPAMTHSFEGDAQIKQLISDIIDERCPDKTTGAPEIVTIASIGDELWIHTPSFQLQDNRLDMPLEDGGKSAMEETASAPDDRMRVRCASAPRTFLNEEHCVLSQNACSTRGGMYTFGSGVVCGSPYEVANKHPADSGTLGRGSFDLLTQYNRTSPQSQSHLVGQRETVWLEIALKGEDQLRQRMAWALSQILVVSPNSVQLIFQTESFLTYYDIFGKIICYYSAF